MNLNQCLLGAVLVMGPSIAIADAPQNYWGMGVDGVDLESGTTGTVTDHLNGFNLRYGLWFPFDLLAIEIRVGSIAEHTNNIVGDPELRYVFGMGKANIPFEKVNLYVLGGVSKAYYDFSGVETEEEDVVGGVGIELLSTETTGLTIEYLKYGFDDDPLEGKVLTLGFNYRFELPGFR